MKRNRSGETTTRGREREQADGVHATPRTRKLVALALAVFALAFCVRLLTLNDARDEVWKVQTVVAAGYRRDARALVSDGFTSLFRRASPLASPDSLGHPPGYPIFQASVFKLFGESDAALQLAQIACDALAAALLFLIAAELLSLPAATVAGALAALSPQFAWNSVLLLPDTLAVLPVLAAVYCIARASRRPHLMWFVAAGALAGVSCWLRANALLLAPFLAVSIMFLFERGRRLRFAAAIMCGALAVVGVLTVRNAIVFRHFIPVSLGAGQTLLEGIADYDEAGRFGVPATDNGIMRQEAEAFARPDYNETLLGPDGIARERRRLRRGFAIIRSHPFWFASVMLRRAASMLRLERAQRVAVTSPLTQPHRALILTAQRLLITALVLPLAIYGVVILARRRERRALALLLVVPVYYLTVQSAVHTEYRYVLAVNHSLFALAAVAITTLAALARSLFDSRPRRTRAQELG